MRLPQRVNQGKTMAIKGLILLLLISSFLVVCFEAAVVTRKDEALFKWLNDSSFNRSLFPANFIFGSGGSAYQYEGASNLTYKGPSIWDNFTAEHPGSIKDRSNGSIADDTYYLYEEDTIRMKNLGFEAYRFSLSWSRILPQGRRRSGDVNEVNKAGVDYYNNLIDYLLAKNIQPVVTLFHFDLPQALENDNGFLNETIVNDFRDYADICFHYFGDRVKNWVTINEPWSYSTQGYAYGTFPPNRCSNGRTTRSSAAYSFIVGRYSKSRFARSASSCNGGNSGTEPYIVTHNLLLAHATAVQLYRSKYQVKQKGQIGITLCTEWAEPYNASSIEDKQAANRSMAFVYGWYMEPLHSGAYPPEMIEHVGNRLPKFNETQAALVKGSFDFIGLNYYTAHFAQNVPCSHTNPSYLSDPCVKSSETNADGKYIGAKTESDWIYIAPEGIRSTLNFGKKLYNNPKIIITENGIERNNTGFNRRHDVIRMVYHKLHLLNILNATVIDKVNVAGYFMWSLLDNFEWLDGFSKRFGVVYVDYNNGTLARECKDSARWFHKFLLSKTKAC